MSLEEEALRAGNVGPKPKPRPPRTWDRFVRFIATVVLLGILTVVYWIPMELLGGFAAAIVLAVLTMVGAGVASRLYHLRIRVEALEAVLDDRDHLPKPAAAPAPATRPEPPRPLEEVEKQP